MLRFGEEFKVDNTKRNSKMVHLKFVELMKFRFVRWKLRKMKKKSELMKPRNKMPKVS